MKKLNEIWRAVHPARHRWLWGLLVTLLVGLFWWSRGNQTSHNAPTFTARRGPLDITVLEGGSLQALEFQELKCEVRVGYQGTKILKIVDEGYLVTEADVKNGKVLCELDSSDLQKQIVQQEIQYQSAAASLTDAEQNYEIQISQNQSDVKAAEQKARFARMDFDKFLGDRVTEQIITELGLDHYLEQISTNDLTTTKVAEPAVPPGAPAISMTPGEPRKAAPQVMPAAGGLPVASAPEIAAPLAATRNPPPSEPTEEPIESPMIKLPRIDFMKYADIEILGDGEAKQKLRQLEDDLRVAQKEGGQASTTLEGTRRLFAKGFVPQTEVTRDEISFESARLKVQSAETAQALYLKYEFVKSAEQSMSAFAEAARELDKARRVAISKLAQARAKLNSAKGQYDVQSRQRHDLQEQLEKCTMRAERQGLVVYGSGRDQEVFYGNQEPIREGATVRERQAIITIPDLTRMAVNVKIHESYIKKIKKGLKAKITVDAFPDEVLTGEVTKVAVLPDSQNRWMNPDLKVYLTTVEIDGSHDWVKPGMSAKVEIFVNHLADVVYVPVQAIIPDNSKQVCYVAGAFKPERREVEIGDFNDEFIEIKKGLALGEKVLLSPPEGQLTTPGATGPQPPDAPASEPGTADRAAEVPAKPTKA